MRIRKVNGKDEQQLQMLLTEFDKYTNAYLSGDLLPFEEYKGTKKIIEEEVVKYLSDKSYVVFVAEENERLLGYICGQIKDKPSRSFDREGYVQGWFVSEPYRNKHVGKQLFDTIINEFRKRSCTHVGLDTFVDNKQAIAIYHSLGFHNRLLNLIKEIG